MGASLFSPEHDVLVNGGGSPCTDLYPAAHIPAVTHTLAHAPT